MPLSLHVHIPCPVCLVVVFLSCYWLCFENHPQTQIYVYESSHTAQLATTVTQEWPLPPSWLSGTISAVTITPTGVVPGPDVTRTGTSIRLTVTPGLPIVLRRL
jgi:hypothetical protein